MAPYTVGWVHNLSDPDVVSRAQTVLSVAISFPVIAAFFFAIRITLRIKSKQLGIDDLAAACSLLLSIAYSTTTIIQTRWGLGLNMNAIPIQNVETFSKLQYAGGPVYCLAVLGFKLSLLFAYFRIAGNVKHYAKILYGAIVLVSINQIIFAFLLSCACDPIAKQWNPTIPGHCIDEVASYFALGGTSLGFDILIIALPFPALLRLHLSKAKKLAIACLFAFGFFITIIQVVRIFYVANLADYTNSEKIIEWSISEINLGIIVAAIQTYGAIFRRLVERRKSNGKTPPGPEDRSSQSQSPTGRASQMRESSLPTRNALWGGKQEGSPQSTFSISDMSSSDSPQKELDAEQGQLGGNEQGLNILKTTEVSVEWQTTNEEGKN